MRTELVPVDAENAAGQEVLRNLTKMYCCEWSQYNGMDVNERGVYPFEPYLPLYWQRPDRMAFLIRAGEGETSHWAGLALLDKDFICHPGYDWSLAEFFVMPKYRRCGMGKAAAFALFDRFPGRWELGRNPKNQGSVPFWDRVVREYAGEDFAYTPAAPEHRYPDGTLGDVYAFSSRSRPDSVKSNENRR